LSALVTLPAAREWVPELSAWQATLVREVTDGAAAARFGQDAAQRERTFLAIRRLEDYARVGRMVACASPEILPTYRRLATTLEECASALRILMGEALGGAGLAAGGLIIQVPVTDARLRRDALVVSLRSLIGASAATDPDWGRGPYSYGDLLRRIGEVGAPELRLYLREPALAQVLDGLLSNLQRQDPSSLRSIASTAPIELLQLQRLIDIGIQIAPPVSSPLSAFFQALQLFVDAFNQTRACARLIDLALPVPLAAMQTRAVDGNVRARLRDLVNWRAEFARDVECFATCAPCSVASRRLQIMLDTALYWSERAIDLLAQGDAIAAPFGEEENRAAVLLMDSRFSMVAPAPPQLTPPVLIPVDPPGTEQIVARLNEPRLTDVVHYFLAGVPAAAIIDPIELSEAEAQVAWEQLAVALAPRCLIFD
jgi:hypothetical protein